jgi:uncharacterized protein (TIGR00369 family)
MIETEIRYPYQRHIGFRLIEWGPDLCRIALDIDTVHANRHGIPHGGVHATLLDSAMGYAGCWTGDPARQQLCMTLNLNLNYIGRITGRQMIATGRRTGGGKTTFFAEGELRDEHGTLAPRASGVFRLKTS